MGEVIGKAIENLEVFRIIFYRGDILFSMTDFGKTAADFVASRIVFETEPEISFVVNPVVYFAQCLFLLLEIY